MSKLLMAGVAAASLFAAAPVFAQQVPPSLLQQSQSNGYRAYIEAQENNGVMNAQNQQVQPNANQVANNAAAYGQPVRR